MPISTGQQNPWRVVVLCLVLATARAGAALAQGPSWTPLDTGTTVLTNVNVIPMDRDSALRNQNVIVRNGRIAAIGAARQVAIPASARRIKGDGLWLMPGIADAHVHLAYLADSLANPKLLELFVAGGVTTVINLLGLPEHLRLREKVARGELLGPLIATSGFYVGAPFSTSVQQLDSAVRKQKREGFDFIKLHGSLNAEAYTALMDASRREGIRVVGHLPRKLGLVTALDAHQAMIAHVEEYLYGWFGFGRSPATREAFSALVDTAALLTARSGTWVTPTLSVFAGIPALREKLDSVLATPEMRTIPPRVTRTWQPDQSRYRNFTPENIEGIRGQSRLLQRLTLALHRAGVPLLMGTDAMATAAVLPGYSAHDELEAMVAAGLTPYEALRTATVNVAKFLAVPDEFGVIKAGARADLILLAANPLADITATNRITGVMLRGKWLDRQALDGLRAPVD